MPGPGLQIRSSFEPGTGHAKIGDFLRVSGGLRERWVLKDQHCWYSFRAHPFRGEFPHVSHAARVRITRATSKAGFGPRSATRPGSSKYKPMNSDNCKKDFAMEMARRPRRRPRRPTLSLRLPRWSQLSSGVTRQRKTNPSRLILRDKAQLIRAVSAGENGKGIIIVKPPLG